MHVCQWRSKNLLNDIELSDTAWNTIVDNMIDILYHNTAREYKTLPQQLVDLITANPDLSVNLNIDQKCRLLRCFVGFPIARHVGILTLPLYIADFFFYKTPSFNVVVLISIPRLLTVIPSFYVALSLTLLSVFHEY